MKLKNYCKRFFTWNRHASAGFTLVELIVVIAILAILAGVAIPVYSGYIKKAERAADEQLLGAVNTAFAAACAQNGVKPTEIDASMPIVNKKVDAANMTPASLSEDFATYFTGNTDAEFKTVDSLVYNKDKGMFELPTTGKVAMKYAGVNLYLPQAMVNALKESTFNKDMTMDELTTQLDEVIGIAQELDGNGGLAFKKLLNSAGFRADAKDALDVETDEEYYAEVEKLVAEIMKNNPGMTQEQALSLVNTRAAVIYTAKQSSSLSVDEATSLFTNANLASIVNKMESENGEGLVQAAIVCGMYTAYVNNSGNNIQDQTVNTQTVLDALENDDFRAYINSDQGKKDLEGYLGALNMINSAVDEKAAVSDLLVNGFNNEDLVGSLEDLVK